MRDYTQELQEISKLIERSNRIAIIPSKVSGAGAYSAAAGLYYMLKDMDKEVELIYTGKIPDGLEDLIKKEDLTTNIFNRELLVTIDYKDTSATKVHHSTEVPGVYEIRLGPISKDYDVTRVTPKIVGFDYDLIITLGVLELNDLGQTYQELKEDIDTTPIINIDYTSRNLNFGKVNLVDTTIDGLSMLIYKYAPQMGLMPNVKSAEAILKGLTYKRVENN